MEFEGETTDTRLGTPRRIDFSLLLTIPTTTTITTKNLIKLISYLFDFLF